MKLKYLPILLFAVITSAKADVITEWNSAMLQAFENQGSAATPPDNTRTLAMASAAMFDAVNSIDRSYSAYSGYYNTSGPTSAPRLSRSFSTDWYPGLYEMTSMNPACQH